jgi:choline dehydrogenase
MSLATFDYVVVGGGAAGCVLAARLVQSGATVALVERGRSDTNRWIHAPATFFKVLQSQDADVVVSEPDASLNGARFPVPQGKVIGGGSSVNGMLYMRGQAQDYREWVDLHGCVGWSYADVLPTYIKQERNTRLGGPYHGQSGQMVVDYASEPHPVCEQIIAASVEAGIPRNDDFNGATQEGAGWYQVMASGGQRQSAAYAFLRPVLHQPNLTVYTHTLARRVVCQAGRATGVEVQHANGQVEVLGASKEVILTAGAFHSPKLLMLSGIGPADELNQHAIDVVRDLPAVGANYHDHVGCPVTFKLKGQLGLYGHDKGINALKHAVDYFVFKRGLLTSNLLQAGACVDTDGDGRPDVQYNCAPFAPGAPGQPPLPFHALQIHPMTMRPRSRGRLGLKSANPADAPRFEAAVLRAVDDLDTLRRGIRVAQHIASQPSLRNLIAGPAWPIEGLDTRTANDAFDDAIRAQARTIYHPAGTCRMGSDGRSVVDLTLRVNGVQGLRVADCSVMPQLTSGNTCAPTMMIADRCADMILANN